MLIQIKHRHTDKVIYECEATNLKECVEKAVKDGASLDGASLDGASLDGANLYGASLDGASLYGASLYGASLDGANLYGANLYGANLYGASLYGANLDGASLYGASLDGASLDGAKNYKNSHTFFMELIRREKVETFTESEWSIIGVISIHLPCWPTIKQRWGNAAMRIFDVLGERGFGEFKERYQEEMKK